MGNLPFFCPKSRVAKLDEQEQAIMSCKLTRDKIKSYIKRLEKNEKQKKEKAKESLKSKNKDKARMHLQQSKLYREQITVATGQLNMLEEQVINIESATQRKEAFKVLEQGNQILKQLNDEVNIEQWEKIADDMNEMKQQQDEIGNFLKSHNIDQEAYEEAIDKEMEALMKLGESESEELLPDAGKKEIKEKEKSVEEEENKNKVLLEA